MAIISVTGLLVSLCIFGCAMHRAFTGSTSVSSLSGQSLSNPFAFHFAYAAFRHPVDQPLSMPLGGCTARFVLLSFSVRSLPPLRSSTIQSNGIVGSDPIQCIRIVAWVIGLAWFALYFQLSCDYDCLNNDLTRQSKQNTLMSIRTWLRL